MPSVSVPLYGTPGWKVLQQQRRAFWADGTNDRISPHFRASEFYCNDGSACPILARPAMIELTRIFLEPMRAKFGECIIISGYRHVIYNAKVGGVKNSQHIYEMSYESVATDIRFMHGNPSEWAVEARKCRANRNDGAGGIGRYDRESFLHVDNRSYKADW